jgi:hypothetical protein
MNPVRSRHAAFVLLVALGGCRPPDSGSQSAPLVDAPTDEAPVVDDGALPVTLVHAGQAPHRELRIAPAVGTRDELRMTIHHAFERLDTETQGVGQSGAAAPATTRSISTSKCADPYGRNLADRCAGKPSSTTGSISSGSSTAT